jgi:hypothetical protein
MEHVGTTHPNKIAKNIVICCDGTGNSISENPSNVPKAPSLPAPYVRIRRRPRVNRALTNAA